METRNIERIIHENIACVKKCKTAPQHPPSTTVGRGRPSAIMDSHGRCSLLWLFLTTGCGAAGTGRADGKGLRVAGLRGARTEKPDSLMEVLFHSYIVRIAKAIPFAPLPPPQGGKRTTKGCAAFACFSPSLPFHRRQSHTISIPVSKTPCRVVWRGGGASHRESLAVSSGEKEEERTLRTSMIMRTLQVWKTDLQVWTDTYSPGVEDGPSRCGRRTSRCGRRLQVWKTDTYSPSRCGRRTRCNRQQNACTIISFFPPATVT